MKKLAFLTIISLVAVFYATGDNLSDAELNTFVPGDPALASEVNQNFDAVQGAINDNDTRITTLNSEIPKRATNIFSNYSLTSTYSAATSVTINAPTSGYALVISSGMIQASKSSGSIVSVYVGVSAYETSASSSNYTRLYLSSSISDGTYEIPFSVHGIFPVSAGNNTFYTVGRGGGTLWFGRLSAIFIRY